MKNKFQCIKGLAENGYVIVMQGDVVEFKESEEGMIYVNGIAGWCKGLELNFIPQQFVECFKVIGISYTI